MTETVHKFEEHKRTEEIERRVQRKERKEKKRRGHRSYHHSGGYESQGYGEILKYSSYLLIFFIKLVRLKALTISCSSDYTDY